MRLRSVPLVKNTAIPRKAAVASGAIDTSRGSFHAYLVFEEENAARAACAHNMQEWLGNHLRVDMAGVSTLKTKNIAGKGGKSAVGATEEDDGDLPEVKYDPVRSVFIGNLHVDTTDEELIRFFISGVGAGGENELEAVRIIRDPHTSIGKGIGFALFKSKSGRRAAMGLDGRKLKERPLRITPIKAGASIGTGRSKGGKGAEAWQGMTATKTGRVKGPAGQALSREEYGGGKSPLGRGKKSPGGKKGGGRDGKRPAVLARKQKQLGLPVTAGGVKKKKADKEKKSKKK